MLSTPCTGGLIPGYGSNKKNTWRLITKGEEKRGCTSHACHAWRNSSSKGSAFLNTFERFTVFFFLCFSNTFFLFLVRRGAFLNSNEERYCSSRYDYSKKLKINEEKEASSAPNWLARASGSRCQGTWASRNLHRASGAYGAIRILNRPGEISSERVCSRNISWQIKPRVLF